ncbi:MAG: hypothetical protein WC211_05115 [Dehalococcoidia bacterium]
MSTSTVLLLGLTVGLPCTLLALAIVYHARAAAARMPAADEGWDPTAEDAAYDFAPFEAPASPAPFAMPAFDVAPEPVPTFEPIARIEEPAPELIELRQTVADLQQQLAGQRLAVAGLLSERERAAEPVRIPAPVFEAPEALAATDLGGAVRRLAAEGLSERSIARRLHVGLEEVRLVSRRERVS